MILRFPSLTKENLTSDTLPDVQERAHLRDVRPAHLIRPIVGLNVCHGNYPFRVTQLQNKREITFISYQLDILIQQILLISAY